MVVKITQWAQDEAAHEQANDSLIGNYAKALRQDKMDGGVLIPGRKESFEALIAEAIQYQEANGGELEAETTDIEGFLTYRTYAIFHSPLDTDSNMSGFWGKVFSTSKEYAIGASPDGFVELFIHELFVHPASES